MFLLSGEVIAMIPGVRFFFNAALPVRTNPSDVTVLESCVRVQAPGIAAGDGKMESNSASKITTSSHRQGGR